MNVPVPWFVVTSPKQAKQLLLQRYHVKVK